MIKRSSRRIVPRAGYITGLLSAISSAIIAQLPPVVTDPFTTAFALDEVANQWHAAMFFAALVFGCVTAFVWALYPATRLSATWPGGVLQWLTSFDRKGSLLLSVGLLGVPLTYVLVRLAFDPLLRPFASWSGYSLCFALICAAFTDPTFIPDIGRMPGDPLRHGESSS